MTWVIMVLSYGNICATKFLDFYHKKGEDREWETELSKMMAYGNNSEFQYFSQQGQARGDLGNKK